MKKTKTQIAFNHALKGEYYNRTYDPALNSFVVNEHTGESITVNGNNGYRGSDRKLPMKPCNKKEFPDMNITQGGQWIGIDFKDSEMYGEYEDVNKFSLIEIFLNKGAASDMIQCDSEEQINKALDGARLTFKILNYYFDFDDFETPVKPYMYHDLYTNIHSHVNINYDIKLKKNYYATYDSYWYDSKKEGEFYYFHSPSMRLGDITKSERFKLTIKIDNQIDTYTRNVDTFLTVISKVGGLFELVELTLKLIMGAIIERVMLYYMTKNFNKSKVYPSVNRYKQGYSSQMHHIHDDDISRLPRMHGSSINPENYKTDDFKQQYIQKFDYGIDYWVDRIKWIENIGEPHYNKPTDGHQILKKLDVIDILKSIEQMKFLLPYLIERDPRI